MRRASGRSQHGGAIGTLIFFLLVGAAGYFVYTEFLAGGRGRAPSCSEADLACQKSCRRTSTEQPAMTACQAECRKKLDACK